MASLHHPLYHGQNEYYGNGRNVNEFPTSYNPNGLGTNSVYLPQSQTAQPSVTSGGYLSESAYYSPNVGRYAFPQDGHDRYDGRGVANGIHGDMSLAHTPMQLPYTPPLGNPSNPAYAKSFNGAPSAYARIPDARFNAPMQGTMGYDSEVPNLFGAADFSNASPNASPYMRRENFQPYPQRAVGQRRRVSSPGLMDIRSNMHPSPAAGSLSPMAPQYANHRYSVSGITSSPYLSFGNPNAMEANFFASLLDGIQLKTGLVEKPPYPLSTIIAYAIASSTYRKLTLNDIYVWMLESFPYYRTCTKNWKVLFR
jgi:hypothetical protein